MVSCPVVTGRLPRSYWTLTACVAGFSGFAMLAFAELCLASGRGDAALFVLDAALRLNPHLAETRRQYERLLGERSGRGH